MLLCFLVQGLIPPSVIANHDLKFLVTVLLPRRSMIALKNQIHALWIQFLKEKKAIDNRQIELVFLKIIKFYCHSRLTIDDSCTQFQHLKKKKKSLPNFQ